MAVVTSSIHHSGGTYSTPQTSDRNSATRYIDIDDHDVEVLQSRNIPPHIAKSAGIHTVSGQEAERFGHRPIPGLLIPSHNTQGEIDRYQLRPHDPPADEKGRPRKYLWPTGCRQSLYVPPQCLDELRDVDAPILITEAPLKALAIAAALESEGIEGVAVVAVAGVYGWRSQDMPLSDHLDIPMKRKEGKRIRHRRQVYILFDSDTNTNPNVTRARWEYSQYLKRRGAKVKFVDVPAANDGRKQGIDDALTAGYTLRSLVKTATPAPDIMPDIDADTAADDPEISEVERLRTQCAAMEARALRAERHVSEITKLAVSPYYSANEKVAIIRAGSLALNDKASTPRPDGLVEIDPGKLSNDFRPTDKEHPDYEEYKRSPVNPNGDPWYMRRSSTVPAIKNLERKLGEHSPIKTKLDYRKLDGESTPRRVSVITMERPDNMVDFLEAVNSYRPDMTPQRPYQVQDPCPHCGEVHSRTRRTYCNGCGEETEAPKILPIPPAQNPEATPEEREKLAAATANPVNRENLFTQNGEEASETDPVNRNNLSRETDPNNAHPSPAPSTRYSEKICLRDSERGSGALITDTETGLPVDTGSGEIVDVRSTRLCMRVGCINRALDNAAYCQEHERERKAALLGEVAS